MPASVKRAPNWYARLCARVYWDERTQQLDRAAVHAIGYDTDERDYYARVEPQILFGRILVDVGREHRAQREACRG